MKVENMSRFISRLKKWTSVGSVVSADHAKIQNFNQNSDLENIEYLIIGTLTPCSGRNGSNYNEGYFYCGPKNWMYEFIDCAFEGNKEGRLVKAKNDFIQVWGNPVAIKQILHDRKIAFLDVVKEGVVPINNADDNLISPFVLDYETFEKAERLIDCLFKKGRIRANSKNAAEAFKEITGKAIPVIPQRIRRHFTDHLSKKTYTSKEDLREGWCDFFN